MSFSLISKYVNQSDLKLATESVRQSRPFEGVLCGSDVNIEITPGYKGSTILNNCYFFQNMIIDSNVILKPGDRILLFGQTDDRENGIWSVTSIISGYVNIQRPSEYDINTPIRSGQYVFITEGYKNGGILYKNTATEYDSNQNKIIIYNGTSPQNWEPYYFTLIQLIYIDIPRFYSNSWFSGSYVSLPVGDYPYLSIVGIPDNTIGSIRVPTGFQVELYEFEYFQGRSLTLTSSNNCLALSDFNNLTSSIKISVQPTFYSDPWYMGTHKALPAGDYPNVTNVDIFDNTISSVAVPTGFIVQLFSNVNFTGDKLTLISNSTSLSNPSFYTEFYYTGNNITLAPGNYPDLSLVGLGFSNNISSVKVPPGFQVELYKNINYGGDKLTLTNDSTVLSSTFNNLINSIKVIAISNFSNLTAFDNLTSSIKVIAQPVFYSEFYYTGVNISFAAGNYPDISPYVNTISSVRVPVGYQVELYQYQYYQGASLILTSSNNNLALSSFDNLTTSIKIIAQPVFYSECWYAGNYKSLAVGEYPDLSVTGLAFDNVISSVKVPAGIIVELYTDVNYGGSKLTLTSSNNCLDVGFDNLVSSIKIFDKPTFYLAPSFIGPSVSLSAGEYPDLSVTPYDNLINSVQIPAGYQVQLYEFPNFLGASLTLTTDNNNLFLSGFGNLTSSIRITNQPSFYTECLYEGTYKTLPAGLYPDLSILGLAINDVISSVRVPVGFQIELYKNANFVENQTGEKITLTTDNNNLIPSGFDNTISSIKISEVPVFYSESFYLGGFVSLTQGDYPDLTLFDNLISSVRVPPGYQVELYKNIYFGGDKLTLTTNNNLLLLSGFDEVTSSIKVTVQPSFFTGYLYTGSYKTLNAGEYPDLSVVGLAINDVIRSVKVPNRFIIELYKDTNFGGAKLTLTSSTPYNIDLSTVGFHDSVSSIKIFDLPTFYGELFFIGPNLSLAYGDYLIIKPYAGIISSVRVPVGFQVELYKGDELTGDKLILTGDNNNLISSSFDNVTNSIKITLQPVFFSGSLYTGNYKTLTAGEYPDLSLLGFDNIIKSVKVPLEFIIELYKDTNYGGDKLIMTNSTPYNNNLSIVGFHDSVSSIKIISLPTFFTGRLYTEGYLPLPYGDFSDLTLLGVPDNIITSVRVPPGFQVTLYKDANFGGDKLILTTDNNDLSLGVNNFNDSVSSIKVTLQPSFFSGSLYTGTYKTLNAGEYSDLSLLGFDNIIRSVKVPLEFVIELYKDVNFGGEKLTLTNVTPYNNNLSIANFNDSVSSIKIIALPTFFTGPSYTEVYIPLSFGDYPDLSLIGDNLIRSVKVPPGFQVTLYKDANFGGTNLTITTDTNTDTLFALGLDQSISSIKVNLQPVFYTDPLYSGNYKTLGAGNYPDLSIVGLAINDVISSVKIPDGFVVELYKNLNYVETQVGEKLTLTNVTPYNNNLALSNFDNITSSIKIIALPTFYSGPYYTQTYISLPVGDYPALSDFDNLLRSVKVPAGFKVELYKEMFFMGDKLTLTADNNLLALSGFDNVTSSIKVSLL